MAASPQFVGTPRTQTTAFSSATYALVTAFTAGVSGSVLRTFDISCIADQQLYATITLVSGGVSQPQCTVPLNATSTANAALGITGAVVSVLSNTIFPSVVSDPPYLDLGADEIVKVTIHDGAGGGPAVGESARTRIVGADY